MFNKFAEGFDDDLKCPKVHFGSIVISLPGGGVIVHICVRCCLSPMYVAIQFR